LPTFRQLIQLSSSGLKNPEKLFLDLMKTVVSTVENVGKFLTCFYVFSASRAWLKFVWLRLAVYTLIGKNKIKFGQTFFASPKICTPVHLCAGL